jgi:hypothetical protein
VLFILSAIDCALTLWGLSLNVIEEANPIMRWLIEKSPIGFMALKLLMPIILGLMFLWKRKRLHKIVVYLLGFVLVVYAMLVCYELVGFLLFER